MEDVSSPPALALVKDLMFSSKITGTARALGREVKVIRDPAQLGAQLGRLLIVDLNLQGAIEAAVAWRGAHPEAQVVGFVSHVDTETIERGRAAGLQVMSRSGFVEALPRIL